MQGKDLIYPSLCLSPGARGSSEPGPKFSLSVSCRLIWGDFFAFGNALEKRHRKNTEKKAKIKDFGFPKPSQNPPKMPSKSMYPKTYDFSSIFVQKMLCCKSADIDFVLVFPIQNGSRVRFFKLLFACIFGPKNLPKILSK